MPDISKINALAIGSVAKVDGIAKASILDIDGVVVPVVPAPAAAYSVRLLGSAVGISSYTGDCMRVRRASDNVEADVGFDAGELKLTSPISNTSDALSYTDFADFVDHTGTPTNAFVRWWYDQSGNSLDVGQATAGSQPKVYDATTGLIEDGSVGNEKPALDFDGTDDGLNCSTNLRTTTGASTVVQVRNVPKTGATERNAFVFYKVQRHLIDRSVGSNYAEVAISTNETTDEYLRYANADLNGQLLHFATWDGSTQTGGVDDVVLYEDGAQETGTVGSVAMGVTPSGTNSIGYRNDTNSQFCDGTFQEVIVYLTDQSSNRTGIQNNVNGFFSIY